ncbi:MULTISPECIES: sulfotransferase family 2 domain-containing protein [unclassified Cytobacillus]|uniref:sulfotransferase family 2 domain-containing protein n=1 Tax=unclassified Cytobacillus TaxID=2675268 RepID=UPI00135C75F1|nr:sulfotransferase family 2 domain-containing protein [Cytobacillus sp. AMY 15.2]KAF0817853.1 hypothetical protein KIS4809_3371 [Bacillus sp. ZZV12-4809]MCM3089946.1 sulfotransferase family 2 domain-containing protein [Cytobacillus sp. AMY 15.2]
MDNHENRLLIFVHILKTGGTTLEKILQGQYNNIFLTNRTGKMYTQESIKQLFSENMKKNLNCVSGHFPFGIHQLFPRPFTYMTILREPIDRVISLYFFILNNPRHSMHRIIKNMSFKDFIFNNRYKHLYVNHQTFWVSGGKEPDLSKAKENLEQYFSIVGITELFNESIFIMKETLGWSNLVVDYKRYNVNNNRPSKKQIPKELIEKLVSDNRLDLELYDYAKKLLQKKIENLEPHQKKELQVFKTKNGNV